MSRFNHQKINGFTLVEVLISMIILAIGLLGLASMQTVSLRDSQNAFSYAQASSLAYEMSERMTANALNPKPASGDTSPWRSATLPAAATTCPVTSSCNTSTGCSSATMASYDYCTWQANAKTRINPTATAAVNISPYTSNVCPGISGSNVSGSNCQDASGSRRCLTICWTNTNQLGVSAPYMYQLEMMP